MDEETRAVCPDEGQALPEAAKDPEVEDYRDIESIFTILQVNKLEMSFGYALLPLLDSDEDTPFFDELVLMRKSLAWETGFVTPLMYAWDDGGLPPHRYAIWLKTEIVSQGEVMPGHMMAIAPAGQDEILETLEGVSGVEPVYGYPVRWVAPEQQAAAEAAGCTLAAPEIVLINHLADVVRRHAWEMLDRQETERLVDNLSKRNPTLRLVMEEAGMGVGVLHKVLVGLLRESVPIRDLQTIIETLADQYPAVKDTELLGEYARQALGRTITRRLADGSDLDVLTLDDSIERLLQDAIRRTDGGSYLALEADVLKQVAAAMDSAFEAAGGRVTVLTSPAVRPHLWRLAEQFFGHVAVISYSELDSAVPTNVLGNITISQ